MGTSDNPDTRLLHSALWVSAAMHKAYTASGKPVHADAIHQLEDALGAVENPGEARTVARLLSRNAPAGSPLEANLTNWWLASLKLDTATSPEQRLRELAGQAQTASNPDPVIAAYRDELLDQFSNPTHADLATRIALWQAAHDGPLGPCARDALAQGAPAIAQNAPPPLLLNVLIQAQELDIPPLRTAAFSALDRVPPGELQAWHDHLRRKPESSELCRALEAAYTDRLQVLTATSPSAAWQELERLEHRWHSGRPAIISRNNVATDAIFASYAAAEPSRAAYAALRDIRNANSTPERMQALAAQQQRVGSLTATAQLLFLGHLHSHMLHEPDLAKPSRDHLVSLHRTHADISPTEQLCRLAIGDDVLCQSLKPIDTPRPPRSPGPVDRVMAWARRLRSNPN